MKTIKNLKSSTKWIARFIIESITYIGGISLMSSKNLLKMDFNSFIVLISLIILFSFQQIKGKTKIKKINFILAIVVMFYLCIYNIIQRNYYIAFLSIVTTALIVLQTPKNDKLNLFSSQVSLWIFGYCEAIYALNGYLSLDILGKIILIFFSNHFFKKFLIKRKIYYYFILLLSGTVAIFIFHNSYLYLILQILIPFIPKKNMNYFSKLLYKILSYALI